MNERLYCYVLLAVAIVFEVIGTALLPYSKGFRALLPSVGLILCYCVAFYLLSIIVKTLPVAVVYALWSGLGLLLLLSINVLWFKQRLDAPALLGMLLIISGVCTIHFFSRSVPH